MISVDSKEFPNILFNLKSKDSADMGVLIGYKYQDRTYIYSWCPTPKQEVKSKQISTLLTMPIFIQDATYADWVLQHTKEVFRLLPSGIQVLGLYSVAEEDLKLDNFALISASVLKLFTDLTSELPLDDSLCLFHFNLLDNRYQTGILDMKVKFK
jgi:hypothetical protein